MDRAGLVIWCAVIGVVIGFLGGGIASAVAYHHIYFGTSTPYRVWVARWGQTCGPLAGAYVGGVVGYLLSIRKRV